MSVNCKYLLFKLIYLGADKLLFLIENNSECIFATIHGLNINMKPTISTVKRNNSPVKSKDMSYIRWRTLFLIIFICIFTLVVCFTPYPDSNGESILQHLIFEHIE